MPTPHPPTAFAASEPGHDASASTWVAQHLDLHEIKTCVTVMARHHGQWRSPLARAAFAAAKERIAVQRDRLHQLGHTSTWLDRVAAANFKHPLRDAFDTDVEQIARTLTPCLDLPGDA